MNAVKIRYNGKRYKYNGSTSVQMDIIGFFLVTEVRLKPACYKEWALNDPVADACGNIIALRKEGNELVMSDIYSEEKVPTKLKVTITQLVDLLDEWDEKVCKKMPQEVVVKDEGGKFWIETSE